MRRTAAAVRREKPARRTTARPKRPEARDRACVLLGDGVGNLVEQSPLAAVVAGLFKEVVVWCPRSDADTTSVLHGMPGVRRVLHRGQAPAGVFDAAFATTLVTKQLSRVTARRKFRSGNPWRKQDDRAEYDVAMDSVRQFGWSGKIPPAYCGTDPFPIPADPVEPLTVGVAGGGLHTPRWLYKRYPHWQEVVDILGDVGNVRMILLGAKTDTAVKHPRLLDLRGLTTLRQSAHVASRCDVFLANDCGMAHVAAAVGTPVVTVFGPTLVAKSRPRRLGLPVAVEPPLPCQPCQYLKHRIGRYRDGSPCNQECLTGLRPRRVVEAALEVLEK